MGYYIQTSDFHGKAEEIAKKYDGQIISQPSSFEEIPTGKALIVVFNNGPFEAAGYCYNSSEFVAFTDPMDRRPKKFVLIDRKIANELTGFNEREHE